MPKNPWVAVGVLAGGLFLAVLSTTLVSVALPMIGRDLSAGASALEWTVDAYVLVYAGLLVAGGATGDRRGRKGLFQLGAAVFGLGSLVTGLAPTVGVLLAGRVVQGLGPALLVPGSLTVIRALFEDDRRRAAAIGLWSMSSGVALAAGPALGGVIVDGPGWRWVFLLNVPLSALLILLAARYVPRVPPNPPRGPFDRLGAVLTTAAVALITYGLIAGQDHGWASPVVLLAFAGGAVALAVFTVWERRSADPLVDLSLFGRPAFTTANVAALAVFFSFVGAIVYFSAYFQQVQGRSPLTAGLDVSAIGVAYALAAPLSGRLVGRVGPRPPMLAGLVLSGLAMLGLLRLGTGTGIGAVWWDLALVGAGAGLCLTPMTAIAVASVDAANAGMASAVHNALRQLGQVLGVAVLGALVYADPALRSDAGGRLDPARRPLFVGGLHHALWASGAALLGAAVLVLIPRRTP
jgi:DHA2 family methylenomycin A resistance protein-like MFS transporter